MRPHDRALQRYLTHWLVEAAAAAGVSRTVAAAEGIFARRLAR
jgi:hypothetical protein